MLFQNMISFNVGLKIIFNNMFEINSSNSILTEIDRMKEREIFNLKNILLKNNTLLHCKRNQR